MDMLKNLTDSTLACMVVDVSLSNPVLVTNRITHAELFETYYDTIREIYCNGYNGDNAKPYAYMHALLTDLATIFVETEHTAEYNKICYLLNR